MAIYFCRLSDAITRKYLARELLGSECWPFAIEILNWLIMAPYILDKVEYLSGEVQSVLLK